MSMPVQRRPPVSPNDAQAEEDGPLPPWVEIATDPKGRIYYIDHEARTTQRQRPSAKRESTSAPLLLPHTAPPLPPQREPVDTKLVPQAPPARVPPMAPSVRVRGTVTRREANSSAGRPAVAATAPGRTLQGVATRRAGPGAEESVVSEPRGSAAMPATTPMSPVTQRVEHRGGWSPADRLLEAQFLLLQPIAAKTPPLYCRRLTRAVERFYDKCGECLSQCTASVCPCCDSCCWNLAKEIVDLVMLPAKIAIAVACPRPPGILYIEARDNLSSEPQIYLARQEPAPPTILDTCLEEDDDFAIFLADQRTLAFEARSAGCLEPTVLTTAEGAALAGMGHCYCDWSDCQKSCYWCTCPERIKVDEVKHPETKQRTDITHPMWYNFDNVNKMLQAETIAASRDEADTLRHDHPPVVLMLCRAICFDIRPTIAVTVQDYARFITDAHGLLAQHANGPPYQQVPPGEVQSRNVEDMDAAEVVILIKDYCAVGRATIVDLANAEPHQRSAALLYATNQAFSAV